MGATSTIKLRRVDAGGAAGHRPLQQVEAFTPPPNHTGLLSPRRHRSRTSTGAPPSDVRARACCGLWPRDRRRVSPRPGASFERVLSEVKARFVTGLTATPRRRDGLHPILEMPLGPVRFAVDPRTQAARRPFEYRLIVRETTVITGRLVPGLGIQTLYAALAADEARSRLIVDDVVHAFGEGRTPILLTERKEHLEVLATRLRPFVRHLVVLQGGITPAERRDVTAQLVRIPDHLVRIPDHDDRR